MGMNPNRAIEKDSAFEVEQDKLYHEALTQCLSNKNMKKCTDEIKMDDFKVERETPSLWMPLTLMMN